MIRSCVRLVAALSVLATPLLASAFVADDSAQNYGSWTPGSNGGYGYGPWSLNPWPNSGVSGFFLATSNGNGSGAGPGIDSPNGTAFGLYSNSGIAAAAVRPLLTPMAFGQTFSIDFDNGWIDPGGRDEVVLRSGGLGQMTVGFSGGMNVYDVYDASGGPILSTIGFTDGGIHIDITQTSIATYFLQLRRLSDGSTWSTSGTFVVPGWVDEFAVVNSNAGPGPQRDLFANNMQVTPEPALLVTVGAGLIGMILRRRRR